MPGGLLFNINLHVYKKSNFLFPQNYLEEDLVIVNME